MIDCSYPVFVLPELKLLFVELVAAEVGLNSAVRYVCISLSDATAVSMALYWVVKVAE